MVQSESPGNLPGRRNLVRLLHWVCSISESVVPKALAVLVPLLWSMLPSIALACTCSEVAVDEAKRGADVVFVGRVESVTPVDPLSDYEPRVVVRFSVARVWKGPVTESFEMHTNLEFSSCAGFFREMLEGHQTLVVYGYGRPASQWKSRRDRGAPNAQSMTILPDESQPLRKDLVDALPDNRIIYTTNICSRTRPVPLAVDDFNELGQFAELGPLAVMPDPALVESLRFVSNGAPNECEELTNARIWRRLSEPPKESSTLKSILEGSSMYSEIPKASPQMHDDLWFTADDDRIAMCRVAVDHNVVCGNAAVIFAEEPRGSGAWKIGVGSRVSTYCGNLPARHP